MILSVACRLVYHDTTKFLNQPHTLCKTFAQTLLCQYFSSVLEAIYEKHLLKLVLHSRYTVSYKIHDHGL